MEVVDSILMKEGNLDLFNDYNDETRHKLLNTARYQHLNPGYYDIQTPDMRPSSDNNPFGRSDALLILRGELDVMVLRTKEG